MYFTYLRGLKAETTWCKSKPNSRTSHISIMNQSWHPNLAIVHVKSGKTKMLRTCEKIRAVDGSDSSGITIMIFNFESHYCYLEPKATYLWAEKAVPAQGFQELNAFLSSAFYRRRGNIKYFNYQTKHSANWCLSTTWITKPMSHLWLQLNNQQKGDLANMSQNIVDECQISAECHIGKEVIRLGIVGVW